MNPFVTAFQQTLRSHRLVWLIYGLTLVLGLLAALPFYATLQAEDQNSLAFLKLLNGFDYTVFSDFMHRSGRTLSPLVSVGRWLGLLYLFLSVYVAGGMLLQFAQPSTRFSVGMFWQVSSHYVGRFLRLFGVTFLFVLVGGGIWLVIGSLAGMATSNTLTERGEFWIGAVFFGLFALTATFILCIGDYAKVLLFREDAQGAFRAFGQAGRLVIRNPVRTYGLYLSLILIGTALFGVYFLIDAAVQMSNWATILFMFGVQQVLVWARVGLKVWALGTAYYQYERLPKPSPILRPEPVATPAILPSNEMPLSSPEAFD